MHKEDFDISNEIGIFAGEDINPLSLISYWSFDTDNTTQTDIINSLVATVTNATFTTSGKVNGGYSFDGTGDTIVIGDDNKLDVANISISFWIKTAENTEDVIRKWESSSDQRSWEFHTNADGKIAFGISATGNSTVVTSISTTSVDNNAFHHVVGTYDGTNMRIYIDGLPEDTDAVSALFSSTSDIKVGDSFLTANDYTGTFDELAIWNRALSDDEVLALFTSQDSKSNSVVTKVMTGLVEDISFQGKGQVNEKIVISGRDFSALLQDITIQPTVFNNTEASVIVTTLMTDNVPTLTTTKVDVSNETITHIAFNQSSVFEAIKQLAEFSGFFFFVDADKVLNFKLRSSITSGQIFDTSNVTKSVIKTSDQELYNRVWVYGDTTLVSEQEFFVGDAVGSVFILGFKPKQTQIFIGSPLGAIQRGGIFEVGPISGVDYLVDFDQQKIVFVSGTDLDYSSIPPNGSDITVNYSRDRPIVKLAEDDGSQSQFGIKTKVIVDKNIKQATLARDTAQNTLDRHKEPFSQVTLNLQGIVSLVAGETAVVNLPDENINTETMNILEVTYDFNPDNNQANRVITVKLNNKLRDAVDTLKEIVLAIKKLQAADVSDADILTRLQGTTGSTGVRVGTWTVFSRDIGSAWIVGHTVNGVIGSPAVPNTGEQVTIGDARGTLTFQVSGGGA